MVINVCLQTYKNSKLIRLTFPPQDHPQCLLRNEKKNKNLCRLACGVLALFLYQIFDQILNQTLLSLLDFQDLEEKRYQQERIIFYYIFFVTLSGWLHNQDLLLILPSTTSTGPQHGPISVYQVYEYIRIIARSCIQTTLSHLILVMKEYVYYIMSLSKYHKSFQCINVKTQLLYPYQDVTWDIQSNIALRLREFPTAKPEGTLIFASISFLDFL